MNALLGLLAFDIAFAWASVTAFPGAMTLVYNGVARPTAAWCQQLGIPVLMGFESSTTRAYAGGDAGEADAAFSCSSFDEVGYPKDCGSWFCAADTPSVPDWALANIEDYAYRYALRMIAGGRSGPLLAYGAPNAVDAAVRGIVRAGLVGLRWKVGTWGMGEGSGPNMPPAQADAELVQSGNTPQYAGVADFNWLYAITAMFCAWFGPRTETAPKEDDDVKPFLFSTNPGTDPAFQVFFSDLFGCQVKDPIAPDELDTLGTEMFAKMYDVDVTTGAAHPCSPEFLNGLPLLSDLRANFETELIKKVAAGATGGDTPTAPPVDLSPVRAAVTALDQALAAAGA